MASLADRLLHSRRVGLYRVFEFVKAVAAVLVSSQLWRECPRECCKRSLAVDRGLLCSGRGRDLAVGAKASQMIVREVSLWSEAAACWPVGHRCPRKTAWR